MKIVLPSNRTISHQDETFVIAEVGSNWSDLDDCLTSIQRAKECGADGVKFQLFDAESLYGVKSSIKVKGQLPVEWLPKLKEKAEQVSIEFFCSAFSPSLIEQVDPFVNLHKLASSECCHVRMLETLKRLGKPILMSTGGHTLHEISGALHVLVGSTSSGTLKQFNGVLMYCVSAYPARIIDLRNLFYLSELSPLVGFSDHSTDVLCIPYLASELSCVIEKHVNFTSLRDTPDALHSLNADEFRKMILRIRSDFSESRHFQIETEQLPSRMRHNRRLIATRDIVKGESFKEGENFGIYRALQDEPHALNPFCVNQVEGRSSKESIPAGWGIREEYVDGFSRH